MKQNYPILILLGLSFLVGISTLSHYGESWDDPSLQEYAIQSLKAYRTWAQQGEVQITQDDLGNYGPSYIMAVSVGTRLIKTVLPLNPSDLRHLFYFLTFLAGVWAFYMLSKRWLTQTAAFGATLLFATQPLLWGHAFINPKDTPFLVFFLLSLVSGFGLTNSIKPVTFAPLSPSVKRTLSLLTTLWLVSVSLLFAATNTVSSMADNKSFVLFLHVRAVFTLLFTILLAFLYGRYLPSIIDLLRSIALPAVILGLTASTRVLGPFAGLIVAIYVLRKRGRDALPGLVLYAILAIITMYLTWPYLWPNPIGRFAESINMMSEFPWGGKVLFNGIEYAPTHLPYSYLPLLLVIQLTEPVWILFFIGVGLAIFKFNEKRDVLLLTTLWFIIPLVALIALHPVLYDNFRQVLFILPPVFMIAGLAIEKINRPILQTAVIALVALPGILAGVRLHPYEYIYYNQFIGSVNGAQQKFELDYWNISYREAAEYMNQTVYGKVNIWVEEPAQSFEMYAKGDFKIYSPASSKQAKRYDYVVTTTRHNMDQTSYPDAKVIYEVARDGALLTVIKKP